MKFNYQSYDDIPPHVVDYMLNVAVEENIMAIPLCEINDYLNDLDVFYTENGQKIEDFLDGE